MGGGLKRMEIQKCRICERGVMHSNQFTFYKVSVEHHAVDIQAVIKAQAMEQTMGSPVLAHAMGPDEDLSKPVDRPEVFLVCMECACTKAIAEMLEV